MARTLLIVDDIKSNREILKNMLGGEYQLLEAQHGQEALAVMTAEHQRISAVLLDLGMPVMDGYEVLSYMRENEKLSQLPVIVTTGQTDSGSEERALRLGAKDYISKPYKSAIIRQRIWNTINLRETAATVNAMRRDRLTGLYSRDAFFERVSELALGQEAGHYVMACFDVDKFKVINDQYGTEKGDEVLRHIAAVFREGFAANGGVCCRVSSDDFAAFYPAAFQDSETLARVRRQASLVPGLASPLAFSIGRYLVDDPAMSPSAMYDRAMLAAESVKGRYDAKIAVYDESMRAQLLHEQEIVTEMETALHAGQFEVWYQPQYNHSTGALIGSEALVRWRHPAKGLIPPGVFVPVFEQNGFIYTLDKYVWEHVCQYLRGELDLRRSPLPVSVNLSRVDVFCADLVEFLTGLLKKYEIPVELLRLEVTESAFAESAEHIVSVVKELISLGFTMEIDDFGSGYSSLNTLKSVPAQVVKLDMRFLEDDGDSQRGGNILESIVRMTKWLGMSVIAEGVERKSQADYLRSIGCSYVQGYLYARPMPETEYTALCLNAGREEKLLAMETVANLDNDAFWSPDSMDTLIFNSYVGAACIYEYHGGKIELLRATEKYAQVIGSAGMTVEEALKLNWTEHLDEENKKRLMTDLDRSIETKKEVTDEYVFLDLPGCPHETHLRSTMRVIASAGDRYLVYCTNENITAQRKAEQREREIAERLKVVMDNVACGITAVTTDGETVVYILANDRYYELLGYTGEQYRAEVDSRAFTTIYPDDLPRVIDVIGQVSKSGRPRTMEYRALRRDGAVVWLRSNVSMASFDGVDGKIQLSTYTDITEQKQSELALLDTTAQLQTMMDDIPGGFCRIRVFPDGSMKPVFINQGLGRLTGMSHEELISLYENDALAGVHPDDASIVREAFSRMLQRGEAYSARYRLRHKSAGYVWLSIFGRMAADARGDEYLSIYYTDATEQVRDEERQKELLDNLPYGVALYEYDGSSLSMIHLNKRYWELVNRKEIAYEGASFLEAVHPEDQTIIARELKAAILEGRDAVCDVRVLYGKGEYRPFHIVGHIRERSRGGYAIYAVYTPISDEAMSVQEMLPIALGAMMDSKTDYSFVKDKNLRYVCASREVAKLANLSSPSEMLGKSDHELFDGALADAFFKDDWRILESGESLVDNIDRIPSADGTARYACTSKYPLRDSAGNVVGVYGIGRDVTENRAMKSQLELLVNSIPGGVAACEYRDKTFRVTYFSDGFCGMFGCTREEYAVIGVENVFAGIFEEDLPGLLKQLDGLVQRGAQADCVYRSRIKGGGYRWINLKTSAPERDGDVILFNAVLFDVTERQESMERLRISEEENRLAMRHTRSVVCRYDVATGSIRIPEEVRKEFFLPETVDNVPEGPLARGAISPETTEAYQGFYDGIRSGSETGSAVYQRLSNRGWRWLEAHYSTILSDTGHPVSAVISYTDVTEQFEKDSAYRRWRQSFQTRAPESYSLFRCNISRKTGFSAREGSLLTVRFESEALCFDDCTREYTAQCVFEEDRERFAAFLNADALLSGYYRGRRVAALEYREQLEGGEIRWLRLTVDLVEHTHFADIEAYLLFEDIDKAKKLELETIEQSRTDPLTGVLNRAAFTAQIDLLLQTAKPNAQHALLMLDMDGFKLVNDAFGHGAGDQVLIDVANALRAALRHDDLIGRLGGDEFLVFLTDIPGDVIAAEKARQICALTRKAFSSEVELSGSVGIAVAPRDGMDFETLYHRADAALYHVKGSGRDNFAFYHEDMANEHLSAEPVQANAPAPPKRKRRMLIVDDSRIDHALLTNLFADDFIIEKAKDGATALIRLRHYGSAISVVLLDLMMPGMDGFAVLGKMQESAELCGVPVIVVSGDDNRETGLRAIRAGAVDFVGKPVDPELLRIRVQSAVSKAENERLRAKNSLLEYQNSETLRYKTALERSGIVVIEHDWVSGDFVYAPCISEHLAGTYDGRSLWHVLLSDFVAETYTVQRMQELVQRIASDKKKGGEKLLVQLKTPEKARHWFLMSAYKMINEFGLSGKIYITFLDMGAQRPGFSE